MDLFCGVGGLTNGFVKEGFKVVAGIDSDISCKYAYETNNHAKFIGKKIEDVQSKEIRALFKGASEKILVGCAPCQPFSAYNKSRYKDEKWKLLYNFLEIISETNPEVISMENVPQLEKYKIFEDFTNGLKELGYFVSWYLLYGPDYGIPQKRKRLVLFASKYGIILKPKPNRNSKNYKTVRDTISNLKSIKAGEVDPLDPLHCASRLSYKNIQRIKSTPEGGGWMDWSEDLVLECHKKKSGKSFKNVYGRMAWDEPSPTITTEFMGIGTGKYGHPEQNRAISLREGALLQTFPKSYIFLEPGKKVIHKNLERQIGNAVPVTLGRVIAKCIKKHLKERVYDR